MLKNILIASIRIYRLSSPSLKTILGPGLCCRFVPSCSLYMEWAIREHGVRRGVGMGVKRLMRCHPFAGRSPAVDLPDQRLGRGAGGG